jgi:hypothetical protein
MNAEAAAILEATAYMTLATSDAQGIPWATPVWFAPDGERAVLWLSDPEARHSRNLHEQPRLAIVIFDSRVASSEAAAVYFEAVAEQAEDGIETFSEYSVIHGRGEWTAAEVTAPSPLRLYRASITERWLLQAGARDRVTF